ncbi:MAG: signal peptidase I [Actinobacteria bacterium]|nr:signal peptidase I [Cyanobacteriota bacterium]MCL5772374.1 signal peptidase I [Actinomycetota bacterium]
MGKHAIVIKSNKSFGREFLSYLSVIFFAALISIIFRIFFFEPFIVPTPSMEPTLMVNDKVIVNKFSFKYSGIKRGDIIVFHSPVTQGKDLVKRAIAFEGETIKLGTDGVIYINGKPLDKDYYTSDSPPKYTGQSFKIGKNEIFVMGDNRNDSYDSRYFGPVEKTEVFGKVFMIYWPPSRIKIVK